MYVYIHTHTHTHTHTAGGPSRGGTSPGPAGSLESQTLLMFTTTTTTNNNNNNDENNKYEGKRTGMTIAPYG